MQDTQAQGNQIRPDPQMVDQIVTEIMGTGIGQEVRAEDLRDAVASFAFVKLNPNAPSVLAHGWSARGWAEFTLQGYSRGLVRATLGEIERLWDTMPLQRVI